MKVLLSSIGSRGDVQPILALAVELQALGHCAVICAAPNFQSWAESYGVGFVPIGPDLEKWTRASTAAPKPMKKLTMEQRRALASQSVVDQFRVLSQAAQGCDLLVGCGALLTAGRSVAEVLNIPYVYAAYCPAALPSPDHPPAKMGSPYPQSLPGVANRLLWIQNERSFNSMFGGAVNEQRASLGLPPVANVPRYVSTDHPWLAADPVLGPAASTINMHITQTGTWLLSDPAPLPEDIETFLAAGEPPIYFGFGSMRASEQTSRILGDTIRALGRRAIVSQGWANLNVIDAGVDCISIGAVDHAKLFPRVAAVVHHGGAGTTTTAALAGKPQIVVPNNYDQYYWAHRLKVLGVGVSPSNVAKLTTDLLVGSLHHCLQPDMAARAEALAGRIESHGARIAAQRLSESFG